MARAEQNVLPSSPPQVSVSPELAASASAPPMEHPGHMPSSPSSSYAQPPPMRSEAPPMELFDAPPKSQATNAKPEKVGFFKRMFSKKSRSSMKVEEGAIPSAPPEDEEEPLKPASQRSSAPAPSSSAEPSSSAPSKDSKNASSSSSSASNAQKSAKPSSSQTHAADRYKDPAFGTSRADFPVLKNIGTPSQARKDVKWIELPRALTPTSAMLPGCQTEFSPAELRYPFVISSQADISSRFSDWARTLWFLAGNIVPTADVRPLLLPAFSLQADIEVKYTATAQVRVAPGNAKPGAVVRSSPNAHNSTLTTISVTVEGVVKVRGYRACFSSISSTNVTGVSHGEGDGIDSKDGYAPALDHIQYFLASIPKTAGDNTRNRGIEHAQSRLPISHISKINARGLALLELCDLTDCMPDKMKTYSGFFDWLTSSSAVDTFNLEDMPPPIGTLLEQDPVWFPHWKAQCGGGGKLKSNPAVFSAIQTDVRNRKTILTHQFSNAPSGALVDVSQADVVVNSLEFNGFHSISLIPIRVPAYLGLYYCTTTPHEKFIFSMSGQTGDVHDNVDRPLNPVGKLGRALFGGAFSR